MQLPFGRQVFSRFQESRASLHVTDTWENKCPNSKCPSPFLPSPSLYCWVWHPMIWDIPGVSCPSCVPPNFWCTPSLLAAGVGSEAEDTLTLCKCSSAITKTSPCYQRCFQHKFETYLHTGYYEVCPSQNQYIDVQLFHYCILELYYLERIVAGFCICSKMEREMQQLFHCFCDSIFWENYSVFCILIAET